MFIFLFNAMLNLTVKIRRRIFLDYRLTLSYILESNLILWFRIREWNRAFGKKNICQKRKKEKENRMTLFYSSELTCQKQRLNCIIQVLYNWVPLSFLPFVLWHFCFWNPNSGLQARCATCFSLVYQTC